MGLLELELALDPGTTWLGKRRQQLGGTGSEVGQAVGVREQAGRCYRGVWCKCASCRWRGTWVRVWIHEQSNCINTSTNSRPSMADELGQHGSGITVMVTTGKEDEEARLLTKGGDTLPRARRGADRGGVRLRLWLRKEGKQGR